MASQHDIHPRSPGRRDVRPTDDEFYASDRPENPALPEDRPRGGGGRDTVKRKGGWATVGLIVLIVLIVLVGVAFFP